MSYEYRSDNQGIDVANPYRFENWFLFTVGVIYFLSGFFMLLFSKEALIEKISIHSLTPILISILLIAIAFRKLMQAAAQLRFFFGVGKPENLAPTLQPNQYGHSVDARALTDMLRQGAINYPTPTGAMNGILYSVLRNLIHAPKQIQIIAAAQFHNFAACLFLLASLALSWLILPATSHGLGWVGAVFYVGTLIMLMRPIFAGLGYKSNLTLTHLVIILAAAMLSPVLLHLMAGFLPNIEAYHFLRNAFLLLICTCAVQMLILYTLSKQIEPPPPSSMACEQLSFSMNAAPNQLLAHLDRDLQNNWSKAIPNRRYIRIEPDIIEKNGSFQGEVLEETQPLCPDANEKIGFFETFSIPRLRPLLLLNSTALLLSLISCFIGIYFASAFRTEQTGLLSLFSLGLWIFILSSFAFQSAHVLWGRMDFSSDLIWVEVQGNYQSASVDYGNLLRDSVKSAREVINIEHLTLRVWAVKLQTVIFDPIDPHAARHIIAMSGEHPRALYLASMLKVFAADHSVIVAPQSEQDLQRIQQLQGLNQSPNLNTNNALAAAFGVMPSNETSVIPQGICPKCAHQNSEKAKFCTECGTGLR